MTRPSGGRTLGGGGARPRFWVLALWVLLTASTVSGAREPDGEVLPRSVYVPVRFDVAPCLREVVIRTEEGRVRAVAPGRIVSQFTFYDRLDGANPAFERLTIEGWVERERGPESSDLDRPRRERFRAGVVITPTSIYVAKKRLDLDTMERISRFRRHVDLRLPERTLRLRPPTTCE